MYPLVRLRILQLSWQLGGSNSSCLLMCRLEEQEIKKLAELRRKEKEDDRKARERVRAQIEADKAARRAKAEAAQGITPAPIVSAPPVVAPVKPPAAPKDYTEARLQV